MWSRDCLGGFFLFFFKRCPKNVFVTNWVADGAPDAKLPRFCTEFRPESNGTSSGPVLDPKIKKKVQSVYYLCKQPWDTMQLTRIDWAGWLLCTLDGEMVLTRSSTGQQQRFSRTLRTNRSKKIKIFSLRQYLSSRESLTMSQRAALKTYLKAMNTLQKNQLKVAFQEESL